MKRKAELFAGRRKAPFTIVELIVAMSIFAILMLILMQIFSATQDVWRRTAQKSDAAEMARTALDLLTTDLQSAIYINDFDGPSFYYDQTADMNGRTLWFATTKSSLTESNQLSKNVEVEYVLTKMEDSPKDGVDLYQLEYYITSDDFKDYNSKNSEWDFETNKTNPYANNSTRKQKGILMDNIVKFNLSVLYKGLNPPYQDKLTKLPNSLQVSVQILDDNTAARQQYKKASDEDKDLIAKEFRRIIFPDRNQQFTPAQIQ